MSRTAAIALAFTSILTLTAAPAAFADNAPQSHSGMRGFLSPQQRAVLMMDNGGSWKSMSREDRHAAREKMRADWMALSDSQRNAKRAALQAKWDALPQAEKDKLNQRIADRAARRAAHDDSSDQ